MNVKEFKEALSEYLDDMRLDEEPCMFVIEEFMNPVNGKWDILEAEDSIDEKTKKAWLHRKRLVITT